MSTFVANICCVVGQSAAAHLAEAVSTTTNDWRGEGGAPPPNAARNETTPAPSIGLSENTTMVSVATTDNRESPVSQWSSRLPRARPHWSNEQKSRRESLSLTLELNNAQAVISAGSCAHRLKSHGVDDWQCDVQRALP